MPYASTSGLTTRTLMRYTRNKYAAALSSRILHRRDPGEREKLLAAVDSRVLRRFTPHSDDRIGSTNARVLTRVSPNFRWIDMFKDVVFPHDISEGSDAATRFSTQVNEVASGHDQRIALWDHPKMEFNVAYGVRTLEQLHDLIRFFRAMRGKLHSFRFLDKLDHTSNFAIYEESRDTEEVSPLDQVIGVGDRETADFQLRKSYDFEDEVTTRPILKPIPDTVVVAVAGEEITYFTVNHSTGIVTIVPRLDNVALLRIKLERVDAPTNKWRITVPSALADNPGTPQNERTPTLLPILTEGERFKVVSPQTTNDIFGAVAIASTETQLDFYWTGGVPGDAQDDFPAALTTDNLPDIGETVTAGFHFHVPVRFDTDRIPVKLEYYGVGSAQEITLVEVRPDEE